MERNTNFGNILHSFVQRLIYVTASFVINNTNIYNTHEKMKLLWYEKVYILATVESPNKGHFGTNTNSSGLSPV